MYKAMPHSDHLRPRHAWDYVSHFLIECKRRLADDFVQELKAAREGQQLILENIYERTGMD